MKTGLEFLCGALILLSPLSAISQEDIISGEREKSREEYLQNAAKNRIRGASTLMGTVDQNLINAATILDKECKGEYTNKTQRVKELEKAGLLKKDAGDYLCIVRDLYLKAQKSLELINVNKKAKKEQEAFKAEINSCKREINFCTRYIPQFYESAAEVYETVPAREKATRCRDLAARYQDAIASGKIDTLAPERILP